MDVSMFVPGVESGTEEWTGRSAKQRILPYFPKLSSSLRPEEFRGGKVHSVIKYYKLAAYLPFTVFETTKHQQVFQTTYFLYRRHPFVFQNLNDKDNINQQKHTSPFTIKVIIVFSTCMDRFWETRKSFSQFSLTLMRYLTWNHW